MDVTTVLQHIPYSWGIREIIANQRRCAVNMYFNINHQFVLVVFIIVFTFFLTMNKLKKISLIFTLSTFVIALLALVTLNALFIVGGVASFVMALFYLYLQRARQSFRKDLLDAMK